MSDEIISLPGIPPRRADQFSPSEIELFRYFILGSCPHVPDDRVAAIMAEKELQLNHSTTLPRLRKV